MIKKQSSLRSGTQRDEKVRWSDGGQDSQSTSRELVNGKVITTGKAKNVLLSQKSIHIQSIPFMQNYNIHYQTISIMIVHERSNLDDFVHVHKIVFLKISLSRLSEFYKCLPNRYSPFSQKLNSASEKQKFFNWIDWI